jgi:cytidylate kinase
VRVVAIDGPGGSGKSTVARAVATRLGLPHLDTGAMYRAVALAALRGGVDPADEAAVAAVARASAIEVGVVVLLDGADVTEAVRSPEVDRVVSAVAAHPPVREELVRRQREWVAARGGGVVEGRDIGTVVLPGADLKVYLTASGAERARRRAAEGRGAPLHEVASDLARRDRLDATRRASPLAVAADAVVIDTTGRPVEDVVEEVCSKL